MIKKLLIFFLGVVVMVPLLAQAQVSTQGGGTGSTSPSGILYGITSNLHLQTVKVGSGLTFTGGTLNTASTYVTSLTVNSANGFAGSFSAGATPALTITTSITAAVLKGNGTAISAAVNGTDYTLITAKTCNAGDFVSATTAAGVFTCTTPAGTTYTGIAPIFVNGLTIGTSFSTSTFNAFTAENTFTNLFATNASSTNATSTNFAITGAAANCSGTNALTTNVSGVVGCTAQPQGTVTNVTGTYPVQSTGGATPAISLAFGTTTANTWSAYNNFTYGIFAALASSTNATTTTFAITGVGASNCNGASALTTNSTGVVGCTAQPQGTVTSVSGTAGQINSTGGATPVLSLANHVIFPAGGYESAIGSTTNATTTNFAITGAPATNCNGTSALTTNSTGVVGCTAQPQGTVTNVTGTYPIQSTGGATPAISTAFGTTTLNVFSQLNTFNASILVVGSSTIVGNATTTGTFFAGVASSTQLFGANLAQCNGANQALNWNAGLFTCASIAASGGAGNWFTPTTYNLVGVNSTSTAIWLTATNPFSLIASSTFATNASSTILTNTTNTYLSTVSGNTYIGTTSDSVNTTQNGKLTIDEAAGTSENLVDSFGNVNDFIEYNCQNFNTGANAECGYSATRNDGNLTNNFMYMGKNSTGYTRQGGAFLGNAGDGTILSLGGNLDIGQGTSGQNTYHYNGGTGTSSIVETFNSLGGNNRVGIGTTSPYAMLSIHAPATSTLTMLFAIGSSTATATTTLFSVSNTGSTTIGLFGGCSGGSALNTTVAGLITCGVVTGTGGAAYPFTPGFNNFGTTSVATSTPFSFLSGIFASSTSQIASTTFSINGNVGVSSSTPGAVLSVDKVVASAGTIIATTTFSTPGAYTYTAPTTNVNAITKIQVFMWGGGGGGGRTGGSGAGGGGGAGAYVIQTINSNFKTTYTGVVAQGAQNGGSGTGYMAGGTGGGGGGGSTSFTDGGSNLFIACGGGSGADGNGSGNGGSGASGTSGGAGGNGGGAGNGGGGGGCGTVGSANSGNTGGAGGTGGTTATSTAGNGTAGVAGSSVGGAGGGAAGGSGQSNGGAVAGSNAVSTTGGAGGGPGAGAGGAPASGTGGSATQLGGGGGGGGASSGATTGGAGGVPGAGAGGSWNGGTPLNAGNGQVIVVITYSPTASYNLFDVAANGATGGTSIFNVNANGTVAIGGPSPSVGAALFVVASFGQSIIMAVQGTISATKYLFQQIDQYGHLITGGPAPSCGTGCTSVTGDDRTMNVLSSSAVTSITVNFAKTYTTTPICIANEDASGGAVAVGASTTPTTVVITALSALTGTHIGITCQISTNFTF